MSNDKPVVSVCMITYNHEKYIAQAIEGVLMQETDFPIELVIGEDFSTDRTREICLSYERRFSEKVRVLQRSENLGIVPNYVDTLKNCTGTYVAMCEGDDFWINPEKLQYQVGFLRENPDYSGACSNVRILNDRDQTYSVQTAYESLADADDITLEAILEYLVIYMATLTFRNFLIDTNLFKKEHGFGDFSTALLLADKGPLRFFNCVDTVYRKHSGGATSSVSQHEFYDQMIAFLTDFDEHTDHRHSVRIRGRQDQLRIMAKLRSSDNSVFVKFYNILRYLNHGNTKTTLTEINNSIGMAFPRLMQRLQKLKGS